MVSAASSSGLAPRTAWLALRMATVAMEKGFEQAGPLGCDRKGAQGRPLSFDPARVDAVTGCNASLFGLGLLNLTISAERR